MHAGRPRPACRGDECKSRGHPHSKCLQRDAFSVVLNIHPMQGVVKGHIESVKRLDSCTSDALVRHVTGRCDASGRGRPPVSLTSIRCRHSVITPQKSEGCPSGSSPLCDVGRRVRAASVRVYAGSSGSKPPHSNRISTPLRAGVVMQVTEAGDFFDAPKWRIARTSH